MTPETEVTFVVAMPGWEVLYYFPASEKQDPRFESTPVIAWGVFTDENGATRVQPVTADVAWDMENDRTMCTPDGDVYCGELERWDTVWHWFDEMKRRQVTAPEARRDLGCLPSADPHVLALDHFRDRFKRPAPPINDPTDDEDDDDGVSA